MHTPTETPTFTCFAYTAGVDSIYNVVCGNETILANHSRESQVWRTFGDDPLRCAEGPPLQTIKIAVIDRLLKPEVGEGI